LTNSAKIYTISTVIKISHQFDARPFGRDRGRVSAAGAF
jgi:hypothetical protein